MLEVNCRTPQKAAGDGGFWVLYPGVRIKNPKGEAGAERGAWGEVLLCPMSPAKGGFVALTEDELLIPNRNE